MKKNTIYTLTLLLSTCLLSMLPGCKAKKVEGMHALDLVFMSSQEYCGGAAPSEEMLKELSTPKAMPNTTIYLVIRNDEGNTKEEFAYTTDGKGKIHLNLKPEHYYVYTMSQKQIDEEVAKMSEEYRDCTRQHIHQSAFDFPVYADMDTKIVIHQRCNPCLPPAP